ncbi:hypothetical protein ALC56_06354 [Trachymyrmex septentrionalis]|uniref:Histone-lysine N-methyltransferase SETMAR n=1 Tax=Trachymyrmex septentrionalis TaxID=34720 RepID=A0A195FGC7_9HYME|nr:hypothetical protein ALC56_06354 [Trachymyrmex septentrionalis]
MRKLTARWVLRLLTVDKKRIRMNKALLERFKRNESNFSFCYQTKFYQANRLQRKKIVRKDRPQESVLSSMLFNLYIKDILYKIQDRRLKVRELADMVNISKSAVHRILAENLEMRKLCARWVPRLLTIEQKQRREDVELKFELLPHALFPIPRFSPLGLFSLSKLEKMAWW